MAALGTIANIYTPPQAAATAYFPISDYNIVRGRPLGTIGVAVVSHGPELRGPLTGYVVRQIGIRFRQLWPSHGQRFPQ